MWRTTAVFIGIEDKLRHIIIYKMISFTSNWSMTIDTCNGLFIKELIKWWNITNAKVQESSPAMKIWQTRAAVATIATEGSVRGIKSNMLLNFSHTSSVSKVNMTLLCQ